MRYSRDAGEFDRAFAFIDATFAVALTLLVTTLEVDDVPSYGCPAARKRRADPPLRLNVPSRIGTDRQRSASRPSGRRGTCGKEWRLAFALLRTIDLATCFLGGRSGL